MPFTQVLLFIATLVVQGIFTVSAHAQSVPDHANGKADIAKYWTAERRAQATPRDLLLDERGLAYLRRRDGTLQAHGHSVEPLRGGQVTTGKPSGSGGSTDTTAPTIDESSMNPGPGDTIGAAHVFSVDVSDDVGLRSVSVVIHFPDGGSNSFAASQNSQGTWIVSLQGFTNGDWGWHVEARDTAKRGGNSESSATVMFSVDTGEGVEPPSGVITNAAWVSGGPVQTATGRVYFEMPADKRWRRSWNGYVCSGTVMTESDPGISIIITAAHCVYDDAYKAFARNVLFIPDQDGTTGGGTDLNCDNDPMGCWEPAFGVVDVNWTTRTFPDNVAWDYAYYVVNSTGSHKGKLGTSEVLDVAAGSLPVNYGVAPNANTSDDSDLTVALGYSYSEDPNFMYCAEDMGTASSVNWWLPSCGLSGGASGGPWIQPMARDAENNFTGSGPIVSVNSWGYVSSPGMAGPKLWGSSAECVLAAALVKFPSSTEEGYLGIAENCD